MNLTEFIHQVSIWAVPVMFAITAHEAAHGYVAKLMGDNTAYRLGRVTLNPIPHIDPIGTLLVPMVCLALGGFMFGWAKPVPVDPSKMRYPKKSPFWVSLAGPFSNFLMAILWAFVALIASYGFVGTWAGAPLVEMGKAGITINLILMIFNLLPLPPLDGGRMVGCFLKKKALDFWQKIEPYGFAIVLVLSFAGILGQFWIGPLMEVFSWIPSISTPGYLF